jgi:hypothetical protein
MLEIPPNNIKNTLENYNVQIANQSLKNVHEYFKDDADIIISYNKQKFASIKKKLIEGYKNRLINLDEYFNTFEPVEMYLQKNIDIEFIQC